MFKLIIRLLFTVILVLVNIYTIFLLRSLGFTYNKYVLIGILASVIISILLILGLFLVNKILVKVFIYLFYLVFIFILFFAIIYLKDTLNFVNSFGKIKDSYNYYYVIVNRNSEYYKISELSDKIFGTTYDIEDKVINKINTTFERKNYDKISALYDDLKKENVDAIVISDAEAYLLEEQLKDDFTKSIRIIKTIKLKLEKTSTPTKLEKDSFILYISGIDVSGVISKVSRSDVNILVSVNTTSNQVLLTTIPRDYYVQLYNTTGYKDKLTHAGIYGIDMSVNTIQDLIDNKIDYYVRVNFDTLIKLIDEIGDIEIYSDQDLSFCSIKQGYNTLNSKCALRFARERKSYESGDRHRGENQEEVLKAIINKIMSDNVLLTKYDEILKNLESNFETNISDDLIKSIVKIQMHDMPKWDIYTYNLDGFDSYNYTYSYDNNVQLYVMEPDESTIENLKMYIKEIDHIFDILCHILIRVEYNDHQVPS